jgi:hypothetical protein
MAVSVIGGARRRVLATALAAWLLGFAAARAELPDACPLAPEAPPAASSTEPANLHHFKRQLVWYRCTRYEADIAAVIAEAEQWIAARAPRVAAPALVLDIDETSLSNWPAIINNDFAYFPDGPCDFDKRGVPCGDNAWHRKAEAAAIRPTLALYRRLRCLDVPAGAVCSRVEVFFITGRRRRVVVDGEANLDFTLRNLAAAGFEDVAADHLYLRGEDTHGTVVPHKTAARAGIESRGFTIIANIGDQESDLAGGHAERTFKLPNPFYFLP